MNELRVRTPEGVVFSFPLASPITRFLAWMVDVAVMGAVGSVVSGVLAIFGLLSADLAHAIAILFYFAWSIAYGIATEWFWRGKTVGKGLLGLRVIDAQGLRLSFHQVVVRNLLRAVDALPFLYLIGGIASVVTARAQRLGDLAANTVVVRIRKLSEPDVDQLAYGKFNSLRHYPHLEARLRQRIAPAEGEVLLQALLRREGFEDASRVALFAQLAAQCRERVQFPPEATDALGDEQYVRNVVEILFRPPARARAAEEMRASVGKGEG